MAWRIVKCPNGKYALFADPVDNFAMYDMTREEAVIHCQNKIGLVPGEKKVDRADEDMGRWKDSLETIETVHGVEERIKVETMILAEVPPMKAEVVMGHKVAVPEGMLKAVLEHHPMRGLVEADPDLVLTTTLQRVLEAALLWLAENPITPTDEQADELWHHPKVLNGYEHYAKAMARDWQRMMFLTPEPEAPKELDDLLCDTTICETVSLSRKTYNRDIIDAYRRGQKAGK